MDQAGNGAVYNALEAYRLMTRQHSWRGYDQMLRAKMPMDHFLQ